MRWVKENFMDLSNITSCKPAGDGIGGRDLFEARDTDGSQDPNTNCEDGSFLNTHHPFARTLYIGHSS